MKLAKYKACICEGSAESAIIDILVDNNLLIFTREEMLMKRLSDAEAQKILKNDTYAKALMNQFLLYAFWILVGKALS